MSKPIPRFKNDEFLRIRYVPYQAAPIIEYREIEKEKVGTWLFNLLPVYRYFYSEWKAEEK
jgi:hypothetical protein